MMLFKSCSLSLCRLVLAVVFVVIMCTLFYCFFVNPYYNVCIGNTVDR